MSALVTIAAFCAVACRPAAATTATKAEPARLESIEGSDLKRVVLSQDAAERIGIRTTAVREQLVARKRTVGGEVVSFASGPVLRVLATPSDLVRVDRSKTARVRPLVPRDRAAPGTSSFEAAGGAANTLTARLTDPPVSALPAPLIAPLYYLVDSATSGLVVGQRVLLELPILGGDVLRTVMPYDALLYDVRGGTWTYTRVASLTFVRHRVTVDYIEKDVAILIEGPPLGTEVVTVGATELFGIEFKVGT